MENQEMEVVTDILVLPFFGQGHLFPCIELCKLFTSYNCRSILIIPSHLSSSIPSNLHKNPLLEVLQIPPSNSQKRERPEPGPEAGPEPPRHHRDLWLGIQSFLSERYQKTRPGCVIMDIMMSWSKHIFHKANVPVVSFITSGACSTAMEYAAWKARVDEMKPEDTRLLSGLPESISLSYSDLKRRIGPGGGGGRGGGRSGGGGGRGGGMNFGAQKPGEPPRWMEEVEGSTAFLINTCDDLEIEFLKYLNSQIEKPVFGVGPLLPETYWKSIGSVLHDRDERPNRESNYTEEDVIQWLDSKPRRSVIYVSFGSEVSPSLQEYDELSEALAESSRFFIWVNRSGKTVNLFGKPGSSSEEGGYYPHGLEDRVGGRGLLIKGWAPQLSILSHPSTGGFLSHCGWNSTVEAIGCGVPILSWPIRGDQFYDAKLVVDYLRVGYVVAGGDELAEMVKKSDIMRGIEALMSDGEVGDRAISLKEIFKSGYPASSVASLKALIQLVLK